MKNYMKPEMEICFIEEEDVLMTSGVTLPADDFSDTQNNGEAGEP